MEKIIQINYQGRNISIEETAYTVFQQYENDLKAYFMKEEGGEETFGDLQYRMAEILEQKTNGGTRNIGSADIEELIQTIGRPSDIDEEFEQPSIGKREAKQTIKKKLYRNKLKGEKVIAGVCSGIANYFSIDPIAVRLVFVLFTIFNIATFFSFNLGILAYIILWIILEPVELKDNLNRKLFRNPKDKVLGGVCSGLAQFFNTEAWIVRLIFAAPFLLGLVSGHSGFDHLDTHVVGSFFYSFSFISYIILWVIVPLAKSSTDYMLLKGEPINISTIQHSTSMQLVSNNSNTGLNTFLKIVAYIIIGFLLVMMIPIAFGILVGSVFSYNLADIVLFSALNRTLALFTILFFVALPLLGMVIWMIRRLAGYKKSNRTLRIIFIGLHTLGWVSACLLVANLGKDNNTFISKSSNIDISSLTSDTLYVKPSIVEDEYAENVLFEFNQFDHLLEKQDGENHVKAVRLKYKETDSPNFIVEIEKSGFGSNRKKANENVSISRYEPRIIGNTLYLPSAVSINSKVPYHFQNVKVTIYVPRNKTLVVAEKLKRQLRHSIRTTNKDFYYQSDSKSIWQDDEIVHFNHDKYSHSKNEPDEEEAVIRINDDIDLEADKIEKQRAIDDAKRSLEAATRDAELEVEAAKREAEEKVREATRKAEDAKREAQRQLEDLKNNNK